MKEITKESALGSEHLLALQPDPFGSVAHGLNLAVQSPPCLPCTMAPTPTGFLHAAEGGPVHDGGAVLGLRGHQAHLLPISRPLALPRPRRHCANHRAVGLGNHVLLSSGGQQPERLFVVRFNFWSARRECFNVVTRTALAPISNP